MSYLLELVPKLLTVNRKTLIATIEDLILGSQKLQFWVLKMTVEGWTLRSIERQADLLV
jgi:hypothetical protein